MSIEEITIRIYCAAISKGQKPTVESCYMQAENIVDYLNKKDTERTRNAEGRAMYGVPKMPLTR